MSEAGIRYPNEVFSLYGYWPTLRDVSVTEVQVSARDRSAAVTLYYADEPVGTGRALTIQMSLHAEGLHRMGATGADTHAFHDVHLEQKEGRVRITFRGFESELWLECEHIFAELVRVDQPPPEEERLKIELHFDN